MLLYEVYEVYQVYEVYKVYKVYCRVLSKPRGGGLSPSIVPPPPLQLRTDHFFIPSPGKLTMVRQMTCNF